MARGRPNAGSERLLDAALQVFSEYGFRKATLDDITTRAGVSLSTLYNYFRNKEDLYDQACEYAMFRLQDWTRERIQDRDSVEEKFLALAQEPFQYLNRNPYLIGLLKKDPELLPLYGESKVEGLEEEARQMVVSILKEGVENKVFRQIDYDRYERIFKLIFKMLVIFSYYEPPDLDSAQLYEEAFNLLLQGLLRGQD